MTFDLVAAARPEPTRDDFESAFPVGVGVETTNLAEQPLATPGAAGRHAATNAGSVYVQLAIATEFVVGANGTTTAPAIYPPARINASHTLAEQLRIQDPEHGVIDVVRAR